MTAGSGREKKKAGMGMEEKGKIQASERKESEEKAVESEQRVPERSEWGGAGRRREGRAVLRSAGGARDLPASRPAPPPVAPAPSRRLARDAAAAVAE